MTEIRFSGNMFASTGAVQWFANQLGQLIERNDLVFIQSRPAPHRRRDFRYPWSTVCRRSMLSVVNCAGCQLGLHAPPEPATGLAQGGAHDPASIPEQSEKGVYP